MVGPPNNEKITILAPPLIKLIQLLTLLDSRRSSSMEVNTLSSATSTRRSASTTATRDVADASTRVLCLVCWIIPL